MKTSSAASHNGTPHQPGTPLMRALEPRLMFDGAIIASVAEAPHIDVRAEPGDDAIPAHAGIARRQEIVFVDSQVRDHDQLLAELPDGAEVVLLDGNGDGLKQMVDYLQGRQGIDAIHILSHGDTGKLQLGTQWLSTDQLAAHADSLARIGQALSDNGDILLYGCEIGADSSFIKALADATGADVAASVDDTGALSRGGNWVLEASSGDIETVTLNLGSFSGLLAAFNDDFSTNTGTAVSFSRMLGGVSYTYTFTAVGDGGDTVWEATNGLANSASINLQSGAFQLGTTERFTITRTDGADFTFTSIFINNSGGETVTVAGYNNGVLVGAAQTVAKGADATLNFGGIGVDEVRITSNDFFQTNIDAFVGDTDPPATPPSLTATATNPSFTEGGAMVDLFSGITAAANDAGQVFNGMTLTVSNVSNGAAEILTIGGTDVALTNGNGGNIIGGGNYTVSVAGNSATVTLTGLNRNDAAFAALIDSLGYRNTSDDPGNASRVITIAQIVDSGTSSNSAAPNIASTVTVTPVNDAPTLTATGNNASFTENGATADLFSAVSVSAIEAGDNITGLQLTVSALADGNNERLVIDGTEIALTHNNNGITSGNAIGYNVTVAGNTALVTLTSPGVSSAVMQAVIENLGYRNSSEAPTAGNRVVTLTQITDSGGTANGGINSTPVSIAANVTVSAVNDAPTLAGGPYVMAGTNEDTASGTTTVATLLAGLTHGDVDGPDTGIAITASSGNGAWQYSTDGVVWTSVGAVSNNSALLLAASTLLRYLPDGENGETASLTFRAWDQSSGIASSNGVRSTADSSNNGGSTAFSSGTAQATLDVSSINDAPVLIPSSPTLAALTDSQVDNAGQTVASFVAGQVSDVDAGASSGIAITGTDPGNGSWQYSLDNGVSWQDVGSVSPGSALLLRSTDRVRFVPDGVNGTTASITYRAWDQSGATSGQHGTKANATVAGGSTPFSTGSDTASITVTAVNDAPLVTTSGGNAAFVEGDNVASTPVVIDAGITVADSDSPLLHGATVQITGNLQNTQDVLGFTNDGTTMGDISASYDSVTGTLTLTSVGGASAAQWQAALRAVTYGNSSENPSTGNRTISFVINDGELDSSPAQRTVTVTAVNDAPIVTMPASLTVVEDVAGTITGISFADVDAGAGSVTVTLSVPSGALSAVSGGGVAVGGSASAMTLTGSISDINAFIAGGNVSYQGALNSTDSVTLTASIDDNGLSGGAPRTSSDTVLIEITPVNDAPEVNAPASLLVTEDVPLALTGISFTDVDIGADVATAQFTVPDGTLDGVSGGGVTITGAGTGSVTLQGTLADINAWLANGNLSYTTAPNSTADETLQIDISDGSLTDSATVTLQVIAINDAPVNSVPDTQLVLQDDVLVFSAAGGNAISISDADAGGGIVQVTLTATQGLISLGSTAGLTFIVGSGSGDTTTTFTGTINAINNALDGLSFTPNAGYTGAASLQIVTNDLGLSGNGGNQSDSDTILITVAPPNPTIVSVQSSSPDGTYKVGDTIYITVTFDQPVTVSGGTPTLLLETGAFDQSATYYDGSGTNVLTFAYTVQAGDQSSDLDYANIGALSLNGATIASVGLGNPSVNTLPLPGAADSLGANADLVIDGMVPVVDAVTVPAAGTYRTGDQLDFSVQFSETVTVDTSSGRPRLIITLDGGAAYAEYVSGSGSDTLLFRYTVQAGHQDSNGIALGANLDPNGGSIIDATGNPAATTLHGIGITSGILIDAAGPVVNSVAVPAAAAYRAGDVLTFVVNASETVVVDGGLPQLVLDVGGNSVYASYVSGSGSNALVFQYTVQAGDNDSDGISVIGLSANGANLRDSAGNPMGLTLNNVGDTRNVLVDNTAPVANELFRVDPTPTGTDSVRFTVTFSEPVSGVDTNDFVLVTSGSVSGDVAAVTRIDDRTYTVTVSNLAGEGTLGINLRASDTGIVDAAGNAITGGLAGESYDIDTNSPAVVGLNPPPSGSYSSDDVLLFIVRLSEATIVETQGGLPHLVLEVGSSTAHAEYVSGSGSDTLVFRYVVQAGHSDANGIRITALTPNGGALRDVAGNPARLALPVVDTSGIRINASAGFVPPPAPAPVAPAPLPVAPVVVTSTPPITTTPLDPGVPIAPPSTINPFGGFEVGGGFDASNSFSGIGTLGNPFSADPLEVSNSTLQFTEGRSSFIELGIATSSGLQALPEIGNFSVTAGQPINIALPMSTFSHSDRNAEVTVEVRLADGRPLPKWLKFDPVTGTLTGQPPKGLNQKLVIEVIARDGKGNRASSQLSLDVKAEPVADRGSTANDIMTAFASPAGQDTGHAPPAGKPSLAMQFDQFGRAARHAEAARLLHQLQPDAAETV